MEKNKKLWTAAVLAALAVAGMTCLTQCVQTPPAAPTEGLGSQVTVDEVTVEDIIIKDENQVEDDIIIDFGSEETTAPDSSEVSQPENTQPEDIHPSTEPEQPPAETTEPEGTATEPDTSGGFGEFF